MVFRRALGADRGGLLIDADIGPWLAELLGVEPGDAALYHRALTHGSQAAANYERLEFLGDRVLGLVIAEWLFDLFGSEPEGQLSKRLNALVTGQVCAGVARANGVPARLKLGKQARDDGAANSDNVLGDVMEALIGALYLNHGLPAARTAIRKLWGDIVTTQARAPQHPKSALQEWAAAQNRRPPEYTIVDRSGPQHAPVFTVRVSVGKLAEASASGTSKQEAETAAAAALLDQLER